MARTPLLRALRRMAEEHREADRLGIPPEEVRERGLSRREFLKRTGAVGAAVAVGGPALLTRPARAATVPRIAIVGGGVAGLGAPLPLAGRGAAATSRDGHPTAV